MQSIVESAPINRRGNPYRNAEGKFCKESEAVYIVDPETRALKKYTKATGPPKLKKNGGGNPNHSSKTGKFTSGSGGSKVTVGKKVTAPKVTKPKAKTSAGGGVAEEKTPLKTEVTGAGKAGALSTEQWAAITPGTSHGSVAARKALDATPEGRQLRATTQRWQDDTSEIVSIQHAFMGVATGKKVTGNDHADATSFMHGISEGPVSPSLFRGARVAPEEVATYTKGKKIVLPPSSFTTSQRIAGGFAKQPSRREVVPVVMRVHKGARGLPVEVYGDPAYKSEKEWVSAGEFTVVGVTKRSDGVHVIDVEHTGMFTW